MSESANPWAPEELLAQLAAQLNDDRPPLWMPLPGPQTLAYDSSADELLYGGAVGGGKTDLLLGLAITRHRQSLIMRREYTQLSQLIDRCVQIVGTSRGLNRNDHRFRLPDGRLIQFGAMEQAADWQKFQGRPFDLLAFDELTQFLEEQYLTLTAWNRTVRKGQRLRIVAASNPPVTASGRWVYRRWAPWLDPHHPDPAKPGELRYYITVRGEERRVDGPDPVTIDGETYLPQSRTFIPARLFDNPYLNRPDYLARLQALPEPLRSQLLFGNWQAGLEDDADQAIPTAWVQAAMRRRLPAALVGFAATWANLRRRARVRSGPGPGPGSGPSSGSGSFPSPSPDPDLSHDPDPGRPWPPLGSEGLAIDQIGVDVARGGDDFTVIACRKGIAVLPLIVIPGRETMDGAVVASAVLSVLDPTDYAATTVVVDATGVGAAVVDLLRQALPPYRVVAWNGAARTYPAQRDRSGRFTFANDRALAWWLFREALDPVTGLGIVLPADDELFSELTAPRFTVRAGGAILIERKDQLRSRIGRSTDRADAVILACTPVGPAASAWSLLAAAATSADPESPAAATAARAAALAQAGRSAFRRLILPTRTVPDPVLAGFSLPDPAMATLGALGALGALGTLGAGSPFLQADLDDLEALAMDDLQDVQDLENWDQDLPLDLHRPASRLRSQPRMRPGQTISLAATDWDWR